MRPLVSAALMQDLARSVEEALRRDGLVHVSNLAEEVRRRNEVENVALEDIETMVVSFAQSLNAAMEFDSERRLTDAG